MPIISLPQEFPGTIEQVNANYRTHLFLDELDGGGTRCAFCDCRPSGVASQWPCGAEVPRIERETRPVVSLVKVSA